MTSRIILPETFAIANPVTPYSSVNPKWDSVSSRNGWAAQSWQLGAEYFTQAKIPLKLVYPDIDSETSPMAYHRNAMPGVKYEVPIGAGFGAYPYYARVLTGPETATLGATRFDDDYLVLKWTPTLADIGPVSFVVRVTDQDLNYIDFVWTATVSETGACLADIASGNDTTGDGTLALPYQTLAVALANAGGRPIGLLDGDYQLPLYGVSLDGVETRAIFGVNDGASLNAGIVKNKLPYIVAQAVSYAVSDASVHNVRMHNLQDNTNNMRYASCGIQVHRLTQYKIHFDGATCGTEGNDNNSAWYFTSLGEGPYWRSKALQSHCTFSDFPYSENGFSIYDSYELELMLHQFNTYNGVSAPRKGIWPKGAYNRFHCIRDNVMETPWDNYFVDIYTQEGHESMEICYNKFQNSYADATTSTTANPLIEFCTSSNIDGAARGPFYVYRNTFLGEPIIVDQYFAETPHVTMDFDSNVIVHNRTYAGATDKVMMFNTGDGGSTRRDPRTRGDSTVTIQNTECHGSTTDGIIDASLNLAGGFRTSWLGKRGAEIYGGP